MFKCVDLIKRVFFEFGGYVFFIVFDFVNIDVVVSGVIIVKFRYIV